MSIIEYIHSIPKAELHLHIEGTLQPELMLKLATRNKVSLPFRDIKAVKEAYNFKNLQDFLDIYYAGAKVLIHEEDFFELTWEYLKDAHLQNIVHTEFFFDPQTHTERGIPFATVINGITKAMQAAKKKWNINSLLILSFLRHMSEDSALKIWEEALPYRHLFVGIGLDSSELGNPPSKFQKIFQKASNEGMKLMAHAGEEGPPEYIKEALDILHIDRLDHGNKCLEDRELTKRLAKLGIALTVCPLSNVMLRNVNKMANHPILEMLDKDLKVTVNSDDPAYFGGNLTTNLLAMADALPLTKQHIYRLMRNAFEASFINDEQKTRHIAHLDKIPID